MNLFNRLNNLLPALNFEDIVLQDNSDGNGAFIAEWNSELTQPTEAEIASVDDTAPLSVTMSNLRQKRDALLAATDWRLLSDQTPSAAWLTYRQALRDLPANIVDPLNPIWPTEPGV